MYVFRINYNAVCTKTNLHATQLRVMHSEFSKSSVHRVELREIARDFQQHNWKCFYPVLFCPTRWVSIQQCASVISKNPELFRKYAESMRQRNMGPLSFDPYKYRRRRGLVDAAIAGADVVSDEEEV